MKVFWSQDEEKILKELWFKPDYDLDQLAELFERSRRAIEFKASHIGLPPRIEVLAVARVKRIREKLNRPVEG